MSQARSTAYALMLATFVSACGGDERGITRFPTGDPSTQQLASMSTALTALLEYSYESTSVPFSVQAPTSTRQVMAAREPYLGGILCPEGGRTGVTGTSAETSTQQRIEVADTLVACGTRDGAGDVWHFTSTPAVMSTIVITVLDSIDFERAQTDVGQVQYTNGALSGTCGIDVAITDTVTFATAITRAQTVAIHTRGFLCGRGVQSDTLLTYPWPD
jgi:hypothetical protein